MTYLASRLRAVHADPTVAHLDELLVLAVQVERMETVVDDIVAEEARRELAAEIVGQ